MNYLATIIFSGLSVRWPLVGLICFLLAYTGLAGFFEELGVLGVAVGGIRPDTVAAVVSLVVLLRRPATIKVPNTVAMLMWIVTLTVPVGVFFASSSVYQFLANSWRVFFWAPTFFALLRLTEKESEILRNAIIILLAINGLLTFYFVQTGDHEMYRRLSATRSLAFDTLNIAINMGSNLIEILRIVLPGTFMFGTMSVFLCLNAIFNPKASSRQKVIHVVLLTCILYALFISLTRTSLLSLTIGVSAMIIYIFMRTRLRQQIYIFILIFIVCLSILAFSTQHSGTAKAWYDRISGLEDGFSTVQTRLDNNEMYLEILSNSYAIIGHPNFEADDIRVGGYNDVVAPVAMWWYYGLVSAFCYSLVILYFIGCWIKFLEKKVAPDQGIQIYSLLGMFLTFQIESLGGAVPISFEYAFTLSFILASCASILFPKVPAGLPRFRRLLPI